MISPVLLSCAFVGVALRVCRSVAHALAGAMREVADGWRLAVARMEAAARVGRLSLQALVGHCQVPLAAMQVLASVAAEAASARLSSAGVLNLLHRRYTDQGGSVQTRRWVMHSSWQQQQRAGGMLCARHRPFLCCRSLRLVCARRLLGHLLACAAKPYFAILERWLCEGQLDDPFHEFMVVEDTVGTATLRLPPCSTASGSSVSTWDAMGLCRDCITAITGWLAGRDSVLFFCPADGAAGKPDHVRDGLLGAPLPSAHSGHWRCSHPITAAGWHWQQLIAV